MIEASISTVPADGEHRAAAGVEAGIVLEHAHRGLDRVERAPLLRPARSSRRQTAARTPSRNSRASEGSAPAPPWTMSAGTRRCRDCELAA